MTVNTNRNFNFNFSYFLFDYLLRFFRCHNFVFSLYFYIMLILMRHEYKLLYFTKRQLKIKYRYYQLVIYT